MSIAVMTEVWKRFPRAGSELLAMLALADWCNDDGGSLYPSIARVAARIRTSESQARRVVHGLIADGWVSVIGNENGGAPGQTRQYRLEIARLLSAPIVPGNETKADLIYASTGCTGATPSMDATPRMDARDGSHGCAETGSTHATQSVNITINKPSTTGGGGAKRKRVVGDDKFEEAMAAYPLRDGPAGRSDALKAWNARMREGVSPDAIIEGVKRYAGYLEARGKIGTSYVKQPATFFGPAKHWAEEWPGRPPVAVTSQQRQFRQQTQFAAGVDSDLERWAEQSEIGGR